ncbi:MAG TPA: exosortase A [Novosphingobium sp.]|jgi:exosortase A|nr:exosortase A [Novosphingobium sp.]
MPPDLALEAPLPPGASLAEPWRRPLAALGLTWLALIAAFLPDWRAMFAQWWDSSTYNHILLVPAILAWLVWQRRGEVLQFEPRAWWPGLLAAAAAMLLWGLGALAGLNLFRQAGAVLLLPASALAVLGPRTFAALLFPFAYMGFLVPFGDELVPPLQTITAKLTVALVHLSQVPAAIDGVFIDTPAGLFEVAEACSGVKFLIAMVALGALVGNVCFRSWLRRIAFMGLCVIVPILANGVRAWGTIYAAQYIGAERAGGVDHLIYGWVFFALVMAMVLGLGWRFFDRGIDDPMIDSAAIAADPRIAWLERAGGQLVPLLAALALLCAGGLAWARAADSLSAPMPERIVLPQVPGWTRVDYHPSAWWEPRANGADHRLLGRYADAEGRQVDVFFALYSAQDEGREAGGFGEGALRPDSGWNWTSEGPDVPGGRTDRLVHVDRVERLAETYYRTDGLLTGSNTRLKAALIRDRLLLRREPTMMLILSAEVRPNQPASAALSRFRSAMGDTGAWMDRVAGLR